MKTIITNNIIFNRKMVVLDSQYMPENIFEIMKAEYISEKEKVIKFEPIDLEHELEKSDFFKSKEDIKPEFNCEKTSVFEKDTFFDIDDDIDDCFELVEPEEVKKEDVDDIFEITDDKSSEYRDAEGYDKLKEDDFWN